MTTYSAAAVAYTAIHSKAYTELYMYNAHEVITCTSSFLFSRPPGVAGVRLSVFAQYFFYFGRGSGCEVLWWVRLSVSVGLSVCLSDRISPEPHARSLPFLCMSPMSVARSSSDMFMTGCITYPREGGDGNAQLGRSVIYDSFFFTVRSVGWFRP